MSAKHSKAPWRLNIDESGDGSERYGFEVVSDDRKSILYFDDDGLDETEANAHLIAMSTDMIDGLRKAARWFEEYAVDHYAKARTASSYREQGSREDKGRRNQERADELRAIIAKAEGPQA